MSRAGFIVGGRHAVNAVLQHRPEAALEIWLRSDGQEAGDAAVLMAAQSHGVPVHRVESRTLDKLHGDDRHQGVIVRRRPPPLLSLDVFIDRACAAGREPLLLILDAVQDPRNFGACLRAADGAGVDAVIFPRDKSARPGPVVARTASGALDTVALIAVPNLAGGLARLQTAGVWVTGMAHDADDDLYALDLTGPSAIVLGNEGSGMRRLTGQRCDRLARIPMHGYLPSLNVATAAAICLYEARRQRAAGRSPK